MNIEPMDGEYLVGKWRQYLEARAREDLEGMGYFHGRFDEYVAQNAITDKAARKCQRIAEKALARV